MSHKICYNSKWLLFLLVIFAVNCNSREELDYVESNQISLDKDGNIEVIGTSEASSMKHYIKSPFIFVYNEDLQKIYTKYYKTSCTTINPRLYTHQDGSKTLSYYQPTSLDNSTEKSYLIKLDQEYKIQKEVVFGYRHRIQAAIELAGSYITLLYNRQKNNIELRGIGTRSFDTPFVLNNETSVPADLEMGRNENFLFCGTQNGFDYPDGYEYNQKATFGFIGEINRMGKILNHSSYKHNQHVFFNDLEVTKKAIVVTGTKQQAGSSMDLLMLRYDDSLQVNHEKTFIKKGYQKGVKTILHDQYFFTLIVDENPKNNKKNFSLMKSDSLFQPQWIRTFPSEHSANPVDLIIANQHIYCLANVVVQGENTMQAEMYSISMEGDLIKKQTIY